MKTILRFCLASVFAFCAGAQAALYHFDVAQGTIPDGNLAGWSDTRTVSGLNGSISEVTVSLNVSGGYNGDLYAYLTHNGTLVPLLNRPGVGTGSSSSLIYSFGSASSGLNVLLSDSGTANVHDVTPEVGGTYQPDGRLASPLATPGTLLSSSRVGFSAYEGMGADGSWTLFFADVSRGGGEAQVLSWDLSVDVTNVPEPVNMALGLFGAAAGIPLIVRAFRNRKARHRHGARVR